MSGLAISKVKPEDVQAAVRRSIEAGLDTSVLRDFLDKLDLSSAKGPRPSVLDTVIELTNWLTMYSEGQLDKQRFAKKLLSLLPSGGPISITVSRLPQATRPLGSVEAQSVEPRQTGSVSPRLQASSPPNWGSEMARYLINLNSHIFHDRRYSGERCNLDAAHIAGMTVKRWHEKDDMTAEDLRVYRYCSFCAYQERYERGLTIL